jgi:hypothetical protein
MRLIAWLLLLANIGFFAWYGIYAPVPMPADNKPSLPPAAHLILLREAAHSDEAAAFAAYENNTVTTTAENMPADTPTDTTDTTVALLPPDTATDRKDTVDVAETIAPEETVTPIEAVAAVGTVTAIEVVDNPEESIAPETSALFDLEHDAVLLENIMSANLEKEDMGLFTPTHSASDTLADTQQNIPHPPGKQLPQFTHRDHCRGNKPHAPTGNKYHRHKRTHAPIAPSTYKYRRAACRRFATLKYTEPRCTCTCCCGYR